MVTFLYIPSQKPNWMFLGSLMSSLVKSWAMRLKEISTPKEEKGALLHNRILFFFLREIKEKVRAGVHKSTQRGCKQILKVEKTEEALSNQGGHKQ